jgi:hypothetical protein
MVSIQPLGQADFLCLALSEMIRQDARDLGIPWANEEDNSSCHASNLSHCGSRCSSVSSFTTKLHHLNAASHKAFSYRTVMNIFNNVWV